MFIKSPVFPDFPEKNELTERSTTTSTYYHTCPYCGAHLDPGEKCNCQSARELYAGFIRNALDQDRVPDILHPLCRHSLEEPTTPLDTLRTLCRNLKELNGSNKKEKVSTVDT